MPTETVEEKKKPVVKAKVAKAKQSAATEYYCPSLNSIVTQVEAIEPDFLPVYNEPNFADVKVLVPLLDNLSKVQQIRLNHRLTMVVDCGVKLTIPAGYQLRGQAKPNWAARGLYVSQAYLTEDKSLKLIICNIGMENPLSITHKSVIAHIWLEPVYLFDWKL